MRKIDEFRMEMEKPKEIYTEELKKFTEKYDFLGEMTLTEEPDIDTLDYIYSFKNLNGTSKEDLDIALSEIYKHMKEFSKSKGIYEYCRNAVILL